MDPDQTAPKGAVCSGFIVFVSMKKSSLKCTSMYAADVKADNIFRTKKSNGGIKVKLFSCASLLSSSFSHLILLFY